MNMSGFDLRQAQAFQRSFQLPYRRIPRPADGIKRQARPRLAAIALHLEPAQAAVEALGRSASRAAFCAASVAQLSHVAKVERDESISFTRRLTEEIGHPKLREHLASVTTIMKLSDEYDDFEVKLDRIHPRCDETLSLPLLDKDGDPV
jgi:hypothetical protein